MAWIIALLATGFVAALLLQSFRISSMEFCGFNVNFS